MVLALRLNAEFQERATSRQTNRLGQAFEAAVHQLNRKYFGRILKIGADKTRPQNHVISLRRQILVAEFQTMEFLDNSMTEASADPNAYRIAVTFRLDREKLTVSTAIRVMRGLHFLTVRDHQLQLQMMSLFNRNNVASLAVDYSLQLKSGTIKLSKTIVHTNETFLRICEQGFDSTLEADLEVLKKALLNNVPNIQQVLGLPESKIVQERVEIYQLKKKFDPNVLGLIQGSLSLCSFEMNSDCTKFQVAAEVKQTIEKNLVGKLKSAQCGREQHRLLEYGRHYHEELISNPINLDFLKKNDQKMPQYTSDTTKNKQPVVSKERLVDIGKWKTIAVSNVSLVQMTTARLEDSNTSESFGIVRKALLDLADIHPDYSPFYRLAHEWSIIKNFMNRQSDCIVRYFDSAVQSDESLRSYILMESRDLRSLKQYMQRNALTMCMRTKVTLLCKVLRALRFLKKQSIVHLGIQPSNILLDREINVKLCDFSSSHRINHTRSERPDPRFNLQYSSPEVLDAQIKYAHSMDTYSFGVLIYELLFPGNLYTFRQSYSESFKQNVKRRQHFGQMRSMPQRISSMFAPEIAQMVGLMAQKCLDPRKKRVPTFDWLVVVMRATQDYLFELY